MLIFPRLKWLWMAKNFGLLHFTSSQFNSYLPKSVFSTLFSTERSPLETSVLHEDFTRYLLDTWISGSMWYLHRAGEKQRVLSWGPFFEHITNNIIMLLIFRQLCSTFASHSTSTTMVYVKLVWKMLPIASKSVEIAMNNCLIKCKFCR